MKNAFEVATCFALLLLLACKSSSKEKPADKPPEPAPGSATTAIDAAPTPAPATPAGSAAVADPASTRSADAVAPAPTRDDGEALVDALLAEKQVAGYSPITKTTISANSVVVEGEGSGTSVAFKTPDGKVDHVTVTEVGGTPTKASKTKARAALMKRVAGKGYVMYTFARWPETKTAKGTNPAGSMKLPGSAKLTWAKETLSYVDASGKAIATKKVNHLPEHTVSPSGVYTAPGQDFILFDVSFDPGENYTKGFNSYNEVDVLPLPAGTATTAPGAAQSAGSAAPGKGEPGHK